MNRCGECATELERENAETVHLYAEIERLRLALEVAEVGMGVWEALERPAPVDALRDWRAGIREALEGESMNTSGWLADVTEAEWDANCAEIADLREKLAEEQACRILAGEAMDAAIASENAKSVEIRELREKLAAAEQEMRRDRRENAELARGKREAEAMVEKLAAAEREIATLDASAKQNLASAYTEKSRADRAEARVEKLEAAARRASTALLNSNLSLFAAAQEAHEALCEALEGK